MDELAYYQDLTKKILTEYCCLASKSNSSNVETFTIFDDNSGNYLMVNLGWNLDKRVKNTVIHVRLRNDKIWIEEDWTEAGVVTDYLDAGVSDSSLVLAFHPPHLRQYTDFAIA
ncbi:XisI protein [Pseudanabaenaceae cyanobacterium LEGE 13415]|nr:XisI protein [Pseudanabaenaceae cyanobacterium LEGE 13415]